MLYIYTHVCLLNDRDLRAHAEFHYTPLTSHVQGAEAPGTGLTRDMMDLSTAQNEAGSDPRGHLGVTWGVYLCAGKPPLADIILSHPPDLT